MFRYAIICFVRIETLSGFFSVCVSKTFSKALYVLRTRLVLGLGEISLGVYRVVFGVCKVYNGLRMVCTGLRQLSARFAHLCLHFQMFVGRGLQRTWF